MVLKLLIPAKVIPTLFRSVRQLGEWGTKVKDDD